MTVRNHEDMKLWAAIKSGDHIYHRPGDRYVVSFVVSYEPDRDEVESPQEAASWALRLTTDPHGKSKTQWQVYDRVTGQMHSFEQGEIEMEHSHL